MLKPKRRVLLVDSDSYGFALRQKLAYKIGGRAAGSPQDAELVIQRRRSAIERLLSVRKKQYEIEKSPAAKASLARKIRNLERLKEQPFRLVTLDVDLKDYTGKGKAIHDWIKIVRNLRKEAPLTKVVVRSAKVEHLEKAKQLGARLVKKGDKWLDEIKFADMVMKDVGLKQRLSLAQLEASARNHPLRKNLLGLKFPDKETFWLAQDFVTAEGTKERRKNIVFLFRETRAGRLNVNTFKALLRCTRQAEKAVGSLGLDPNGIVVETKK